MGWEMRMEVGWGMGNGRGIRMGNENGRGVRMGNENEQVWEME